MDGLSVSIILNHCFIQHKWIGQREINRVFQQVISCDLGRFFFQEKNLLYCTLQLSHSPCIHLLLLCVYLVFNTVSPSSSSSSSSSFSSLTCLWPETNIFVSCMRGWIRHPAQLSLFSATSRTSETAAVNIRQRAQTKQTCRKLCSLFYTSVLSFSSPLLSPTPLPFSLYSLSSVLFGSFPFCPFSSSALLLLSSPLFSPPLLHLLCLSSGRRNSGKGNF